MSLLPAMRLANPGAGLSFTVESGDGTVDVYETNTDAEGRAVVNFTMGSQDSVLRADAWFAGTISSAAMLNFTAADTEPEWVL